MTVLRAGFFLLAVCAVASASVFTLFGHPQVTFSQTAGTMNGYLWSDTVGWISLNCLTGGPAGGSVCGSANYSVAIAGDGALTGYAWSDAVGWVSTNPADLSGCPSAPCTARMNGTALEGWMRALGGGTAESGGWDGFISLSGASPAYGPTVSGTDFSGFAWGSTVVGWVDFQYATTDWTPCTTNYQCVDDTHYDDICTIIIENEECSPGLICVGGPVACVIPADANGDLWLSPQLVPTGNTTIVEWDAEGTSSCRVFGENGDEWYGAETGMQTSSAIIETTLYTLECANDLGLATTTVDTVTAVVVPTWVER